ncbi:TrkH family potassium uptake protein [Euzebya tangerina]|uniref:TrkH family potassium uptake protein n=1 Tax=Euzebya tangerina TaxID=591198 RepID=UPI000E313E4A|nr:TrkH family potassium uptake protein [Euzebya tangerina]
MSSWSDGDPDLSPSQIIALSFAGLIAVGTLLLALPISHGAERVGILDAAFTATSAVCVTGLIVVDTGTAFSGFGQIVIATLFQLGGLGLLTFGTFLALATGRRLGYGERLRLQQQVSATEIGGLVGLIRSIGSIVLITELIGALLLYTRFVETEGVGRGAWFSLFHSISAFNNAGFSLYPDSLVRYVGDPIVNATVIGLIIAGGLGFIVFANLDHSIRGPKRVTLTLHTKMTLRITVFLLASGTVAIMVFEWSNPATLADMSLGSRLLASVFQSTTARTAGFNTLDYAEMNPATLLLTMLLMFIGGNPGSTAGGIKTITFYVLVVSIWSVIRGRGDAVVFGRRLPTATVVRAGAISFGAVMIGGAALTLLAFIEPDIPFLPLMFETVSALGTVGLSMGATGELSSAGKCVIILLMYLGRIGFLTFALALVERQRSARHSYLAEEVVIG